MNYQAYPKRKDSSGRKAHKAKRSSVRKHNMSVKFKKVDDKKAGVK